MVPYVNWDNTIYFDHDRVVTPSTLQEIVAVVKSANDKGRRLRVLGSGHSWSPVAASSDLLLSLINYNGVVAMDERRMTVTVKGGTRLSQISAALSERGFALSILPSVSSQTIAGAIATAAHGTGIGSGNMATLVTQLEMVLANGTVLVLSEADNPDLFKASVVSVGLLGVVTEVTLRIGPAFNLHETLEPVPLQECLDHSLDLMRSAEHVKFWIDFHSEICAVFRVNRTTEEPRDAINVQLMKIKGYFFEVYQWVVNEAPHVVGCWMMKILVGSGLVFPPHDRVEPHVRVFNIPFHMVMDEEAEVAVNVSDCKAAMMELREIVRGSGIAVNFITEVRFVKGDDLWLSHDYQRDSCHITQLLYNPEDAKRAFYFGQFYRNTRKFQGRPHWGKKFVSSLSDMTRIYPKMTEFLELRKEFDPKGTFVNRFLGSTFKL